MDASYHAGGRLGAAGKRHYRRTVCRILNALGYALRVNHKKLAGASHPDRNRQFDRIAELRARALNMRQPLVSVDTKKKELIGCFRNAGACWRRDPKLVNDHDFRSQAEGRAIPYGLYDLQANTGAFYVGLSHDTPQFAVDCIAAWWKDEGQHRYPEANEICILADSGGSNGCRPRAWKYFLQHKLANEFQLAVTVAHYPTGTSKWNPIEHRLFSEVSKNWPGVPLETIEVILNYLSSTTTQTGLTVTASLMDSTYERGLKIRKHEMDQLNIKPHDSVPQWNYTIRPLPANQQTAPKRGG